MEPQFSPQQKRIQQVKIKFVRDYPPYAYFNPGAFLVALNQNVKSRYDIQFIHVRYLITKNKWQRQLNQIYQNQADFHIERGYNNVFELSQKEDGGFLKNFIFNDSVKLQPPPDYNPQIDQKKLERQKQLQEQKALKTIQQAVKQIMAMYNGEHSQTRQSVRAINSFLMASNKEEFMKNQIQIYAKGITHQPVITKMKEDKNSKKPIQIKTKNNALVKIFLHPTDQHEPTNRLRRYEKISDWGLGTLYQSSELPQYYDYFSTRDLQIKANKINASVKLISQISFNQKQNGGIQSFSVLTYLWNQIILKVTVKLAQIKKIEKARQIKYQGTTQQRVQTQYYFHLTYPPMYFISLLKKQQANTNQYIKNWDRVENFVLLSNKYTENNYFLRYYLFNNSIFKINCKNGQGYNVEPAIEKLQALKEKFNRTIETIDRKQLYKPINTKNGLKSLQIKFPYNKFQRLFKQHPSLQIQDYDKIWKIKYLLLVMARFNYIYPEEITQVLNHMGQSQNIEHLDSYLYILWKTAINMWGYNNNQKRFYKYLLDQFQNIKKMDISNLLKKMMKSTDLIIYIFRVSLTPSGYLMNPPTPQMKGRLMKQFSKQSEFFLRVSLNQENQIQLKNQKYITKMMFRKQMSNIKILNRQYIPLGWSPSQLRSFSLWYVHEIQPRKQVQKLKRDYILSFLGNFDKISNPAKKAARIGQSFSSSWTYDAQKIVCQNIEDQYSSQRYLFTDGIGKISAYLLEMISLKLSIRQLSVIQMRYKGAKGVLALDPTLNKNIIQLRPSMVKYECEDKHANKYLDILDWNKYKAGYLNRQIIILLKTLGIDDRVFFDVQNQHIKTLSSMTFKDCSIFKHLNDDLNTEINNLQPANKTILDLLKSGFMLEKQPFFRGVLETLKKNGYHQLKVKSNILVKNSARIIGIIDEYKVLQENQIYCSVHDPYALQPIRNTVEGSIMITRNPCLHPADIRVVKGVSAVQIKQRFDKIGIKQNRFEKFVNTVIFPMKGEYPLTAQISGSDLDGDNFFVCWDPRLIPKEAQKINLIDQAVKPAPIVKKQEKLKTTDQMYPQMLDFFINYTNYEKLGQIDNSHLVHADQDLNEYAKNSKCMKLSEIHGKAVDFPKTGYCPPVPTQLFVSEYPDFMEKQNSDSYISISILGKLYRQIKQKIQNLLQQANSQVYGHQIDLDLLYNYPFDQSIQQVAQCIKISSQYEKDLENLIQLIGVDSQYQIYSGNFSTVKNKVKTFGKNRLISSILSLRDRYFMMFLQNFEEDRIKYIQCPLQEHIKKKRYFTEEVYKKAQLMYLVTYIHKYKDLKIPQLSQPSQKLMKNFEALKEQVQNIYQSKLVSKQGKYCGFIWFVIPKIIINLKITSKSECKGDNELEEINEDKNNILDYQNQDYDDGQL